MHKGLGTQNSKILLSDRNKKIHCAWATEMLWKKQSPFLEAHYLTNGGASGLLFDKSNSDFTNEKCS